MINAGGGRVTRRCGKRADGRVLAPPAESGHRAAAPQSVEGVRSAQYRGMPSNGTPPPAARIGRGGVAPRARRPPCALACGPTESASTERPRAKGCDPRPAQFCVGSQRRQARRVLAVHEPLRLNVSDPAPRSPEESRLKRTLSNLGRAAGRKPPHCCNFDDPSRHNGRRDRPTSDYEPGWVSSTAAREPQKAARRPRVKRRISMGERASSFCPPPLSVIFRQ